LRFQFEDYVLDADRRELCRGPDLVPLAPRVFDLLDYLIRNRQRVVSKDDLIAAVWDGRILGQGLDQTLFLAAVADGASNCIDTCGQRRFGNEASASWEPCARTRSRQLGQPRPPRSNPRPPPLALPDKPSIAVLPFTNVGGDCRQL
jgi:hypothetical protein